MREMKDSGIEWIGAIPEGWKVSRIKQLFSEVNERCENGENYTLLSVSEYYGVAPKSERISDDDMLTHAETLDGYKICKENDLVMNIMLAWKRALGVSEYTGIVSPAYCIYQGKQNMCTKYFHYLFRTDMYANLFKQYSTGIIDSRLRLYPDKFLALKCQVPPIDTQCRIADYLDRKCSQIDTIIARQQEVIEKLKTYKLSVITEAVTKGLNPNVPMKDSGVEWIGEIPEHWTMLKLKYASSILRGKFNHRPRNDPAYYDGNHPFVQTGDVARANKYIKNYSQTLNEKGYAVSKEFPANSICMTIAANVGDVAILTFDACFPDSVVGFVPSDNIAWNYLYYVLTAMKKQFVRNAIISTQLNLNIEIIKEEFIPVAPLHIQEQISRFLDDKCFAIDRTISAKQCVIDKLTDYKKSLIYEVVTGKKEV
ncbi:restriction endonuclease subunit S [uncultured Oscillibacter sp.]|uniref:restriction endonuclease subunit S n=1 Tax=uncultured Oscillibacter sp. TaxID=876091 RepID=UPI0025E559E8|nr:restriction endonuclease subunit S [uncultured Oscillibacter sp.]